MDSLFAGFLPLYKDCHKEIFLASVQIFTVCPWADFFQPVTTAVPPKLSFYLCIHSLISIALFYLPFEEAHFSILYFLVQYDVAVSCFLFPCSLETISYKALILLWYNLIPRSLSYCQFLKPDIQPLIHLGLLSVIFIYFLEAVWLTSCSQMTFFPPFF